MGNQRLALISIRWGIIGGFATVIAYPLLIFTSPPDLVTVTLAALLGPLLGLASWGLRAFLGVHRRTVAGDLGLLFNALAGALLAAMLLVQLAVRMNAGGGTLDQSIIAIWLGLDVAWDTYVCLGTFLFAFAAFRHPRLGRVVGGTGMVLAALVLVLNYYTFPTPPGEAGSADLGPLVGLWYLVVTVMVLLSFKWAKERLSASGDIESA